MWGGVGRGERERERERENMEGEKLAISCEKKEIIIIIKKFYLILSTLSINFLGAGKPKQWNLKEREHLHPSHYQTYMCIYLFFFLLKRVPCIDVMNEFKLDTAAAAAAEIVVVVVVVVIVAVVRAIFIITVVIM